MVDKEKEIIDAQYEEIEESLKQLEWERLFETDNLPAVVNKGNTLPAVVNKGNTLPSVVNKGNTLPTTTNKGNTLPAVVNNNGGGLPTTTGNNLPVPVGNREVVLKQQGEIIKREQKELQAYQQGDVNCTVFYSPAVDNQMAMAFSSPFNVVCVNPKVAENNENGVDRPLFKKGLFKFYTFKTDKSNQKEFTEYLRKQMKDSVMKTYEIIKFAALNYQILKEEDGKLMVGDKAQNTSIPALGNFTPQEFCDIFNGDKDAYEFYKAEYAGGSTSTESQQPQNGQENGQENTQQTSQQNSQKIHNRGICLLRTNLNNNLDKIKEILSRIKIRLRNHRTMEEITSQTIIPKRTYNNHLTVPTLSRNPINNNLNPTTIQTNRTNKGTAKSLSNGIKSSGIGLKARKTKVSTLMTR